MNFVGVGIARVMRTSAAYFDTAHSLGNLRGNLNFLSVRNCSRKGDDFSSRYQVNQVDNLKSHEVEFCPTRAKDVLQSAVAETEEECKHNIHDQRNTRYDIDSSSAQDFGDREHVEAYKAQGSVSLNAVMQSTVPEPFSSNGKAPTHLNMPGGSWSQEQKYLSEHRQQTHPSRQFKTDSSDQSKSRPTQGEHQSLTGLDSGSQNSPPQLTQRMKLKMTIRDYGSTVVVFHVGISLMSLGGCYLLVSSGVDIISVLEKIGVSENLLKNSVAVGSSQFLVAYAVHKVFAPVRIGITLAATPIIVRYLRRVGILKVPKPKVKKTE